MTDIFKNYEELLKERSDLEKRWKKFNYYVSNKSNDNYSKSEIYDNSPWVLGNVATNALKSYIWTKGENTPSIHHFRYPKTGVSQDIEEYDIKLTSTLSRYLGNSETNLDSALFGAIHQGNMLGTGIIAVNETEDSSIPFYLTSLNIEDVVISENSMGKVDTFYILNEYRIHQLIEQFGENANYSKSIKEKIQKNNLNEKVKILELIEPNGIKKDNLTPFVRRYFEYEAKNKITEINYKEQPIFAFRNNKKNSEIYGQGAGVFMLETIITLNMLCKQQLLSVERIVNPPIYTLDSFISNIDPTDNDIDLTPGSINNFRINNTSTIKPFGEMLEKPRLVELWTAISDLRQQIRDAYLIDRLLDFNNNVEMSATEASIRSQIRNSLLSSMRTPIYSELITPILKTCISIMFRKNKLGRKQKRNENIFEKLEDAISETELIIPSSISNTKNFLDFDIKYKSIAGEEMRDVDISKAKDTLDIIAKTSNLDQRVLTTVDIPDIIRKIAKINDIPTNSEEKQKEIAEEMLKNFEGVQNEQAV